MAFPQVGNTSSNSSAKGTSHVITLPANIIAGDLLLVFFATDGDNVINNWNGFTEIFSTSNGADASLHIAWKTAVGSDTLTIGCDENEDGAYACYRITGHSTSQAPEVSTGAANTNDSPDPDLLTPTGGAKDYLWIAAEGNDHLDTTLTWPTNFSSNNLEACGGAAGSCNIGIGSYESNASDMNPAVFTIDASEQWIACTVAVHPAGATAYTLPCDGGSYAIAGTVADLLYSRLIPIGAGGYAISGQVASPLYNRLIPIGAGAYALAGQTVGLVYTPVDKPEWCAGQPIQTQTIFKWVAGQPWIVYDSTVTGYTLTCDGGSYSITGQVASTLHSRRIPIASGSYAISGQVASLLKSSLIGIDAGVYSISGQVADLLSSRLIPIGAGSYIIAGQTADLIYTAGYILTAESGSYLLTGQAANGLYSRIIPLASGSYSINGQVADLIYTSGYVLIAEAGSYTLAGQAVNLLKSNRIDIGLGSYTLAGQAADLYKLRTLLAEAGGYALSGQAASLLKSNLLSPDAGVYVITGQAAQLLIDRIISAGAGNYTLTGQDLALLKSSLIAIEGGAYVLAGQAVTFDYSGAITYATMGPHPTVEEDVIFIGGKEPTLIGKEGIILISEDEN